VEFGVDALRLGVGSIPCDVRLNRRSSK
jgi:hypothetical protein